jgi:membrane protein
MEASAPSERPSVIERVKQIRLVRFVMAVTKHYGNDAGPYLAASITYYGFLSLFPLLLLGLSVIGFVLVGDVAQQTQWASRLAKSLPGLAPLIGKTIETLVRKRATAGVVGLAGLLWTGTGAIQAAGFALGKILRKPDMSKEGFVKEKAWAVANTVLLGVLAIVSTAVVAGAAGIRVGGFAGYLWRGLAAVFGLCIDFGLFVAAYRLLTRGWGPPFSKLWRGAMLGAAGWTLLKLFGAWYAVRTASSATAVYGTFASVVGVLLILYLASQLFLYGAEVNAVINVREKGGSSKEGSDQMKETEGDRKAESNGTEKSPEDLSTPQLMKSIAGDSATLVTKQLELAKHEIVEAITARVKATVAIVAAVILGLIALIFLGISVASALDNVMEPWASRLVVAGGFLLITLVAVAFALARFKEPMAPEKTKETIKEDVEWAKDQLKRSKR